MSRYLLVLSGLALVACNQPVAQPTPAPDPLPNLRSGALGDGPSFSGQLTNWTAGKTAVLSLRGSPDQIGEVSADGRFAFTLAGPPSQIRLGPAAQGWFNSSPDEMDKPCDLNTVRASPPEATLARWSTNGILVKFKAASLRAQTSPVPIYPSLVRTQYTQSTQTRREVELVYASQAVRIQGQRVCRYNANYFSSPTAAWWYRTHSINLDLKAGWNEVLVTNIYADADKLNRTIIEGGAGSPPVVWAYVGDPSLGTPTP